MNKVILIGRLTRDPEVRYSQGQNQTAIVRFSMAVDRKFKRDGELDADFLNCIAFGKTAEVLERYCGKGSKIMVEGRLQNNNYTDKNGNKIYSLQITVESIEFCERSGAANGGNNVGSQQAATATSGDDFLKIPDGIDEELPFN